MLKSKKKRTFPRDLKKTVTKKDPLSKLYLMKYLILMFALFQAGLQSIEFMLITQPKTGCNRR